MEQIPIHGKHYTAKQIKEHPNGWHPCKSGHCKIPHLCNDQCTWAYWNMDNRENTRYLWGGNPNNPVYNGFTWHRSHLVGDYFYSAEKHAIMAKHYREEIGDFAVVDFNEFQHQE